MVAAASKAASHGWVSEPHDSVPRAARVSRSLAADSAASRLASRASSSAPARLRAARTARSVAVRSGSTASASTAGWAASQPGGPGLVGHRVERGGPRGVADRARPPRARRARGRRGRTRSRAGRWRRRARRARRPTPPRTPPPSRRPPTRAPTPPTPPAPPASLSSARSAPAIDAVRSIRRPAIMIAEPSTSTARTRSRWLLVGPIDSSRAAASVSPASRSHDGRLHPDEPVGGEPGAGGVVGGQGRRPGAEPGGHRLGGADEAAGPVLERLAAAVVEGGREPAGVGGQHRRHALGRVAVGLVGEPGGQLEEREAQAAAAVGERLEGDVGEGRHHRARRAGPRRRPRRGGVGARRRLGPVAEQLGDLAVVGEQRRRAAPSPARASGRGRRRSAASRRARR